MEYLTSGELLPFQRRWLKAALAPSVDLAIISMPRGNGKSTLAAHVICRHLDPDDPLFQRGAECVLASASMVQARIVFRVARAALEASPRSGEYQYLDSHQRIGIRHKPSNARLEVRSRSGKTAMGLVGVPLVVIDEPACLETRNGEVLWAAVRTAASKPRSPLKAILIGTIAPAERGWWWDLCLGDLPPRAVRTVLQGDPQRWDQAAAIRKANPLMWRFPASRRGLLAERDAARRDSRLRAQFEAYRLNIPSRDTETALLAAADWAACAAREPAPRGAEPPIVGIDLGASRSWSAAVAIWPDTLRVEAVAVAPGIPSLRDQERRDRVPSRVYEDLAERGLLLVDQGRRVARPSVLVEAMGAFGPPSLVVCDRFRLAELMDSAAALPIQSRVTRWSEAAADIRDLRQLVLDEGLSIDRPSALLLSASIAQATVEGDRSGNVRLVKNSREARDDVAAALLLAAGAVGRLRREPVAEVMTVWAR